MSGKGVFEKWFDRLVRNKMGGAAIATAGMAVGIATTGASIPFPEPFNAHVATIGVCLTAASAMLFVGFALGYLLSNSRAP